MGTNSQDPTIQTQHPRSVCHLYPDPRTCSTDLQHLLARANTRRPEQDTYNQHISKCLEDATAECSCCFFKWPETAQRNVLTVSTQGVLCRALKNFGLIRMGGNAHMEGACSPSAWTSVLWERCAFTYICQIFPSNVLQKEIELVLTRRFWWSNWIGERAACFCRCFPVVLLKEEPPYHWIIGLNGVEVNKSR